MEVQRQPVERTCPPKGSSEPTRPRTNQNKRTTNAPTRNCICRSAFNEGPGNPQHCFGRFGRPLSTTLLGHIWTPKVTNTAWGFLGPENPQHCFERFGRRKSTNRSPWEGMSFPPAALEPPPCDLQPSTFDLRPPNPQGPEQTRTKRTTNAPVRNGICRSAFNHTPASRNERPASKGGAAVLPPWGLQFVKYQFSD